MNRTLFAWIGNTDLRVPTEEATIGIGPIGQAVTAQEFSQVVLLTNYPESRISAYLEWLGTRTSASVSVLRKELSSPTNFEDIYQVAKGAVEAFSATAHAGELVFHISPGTPAMAAVWIILAKTTHPAQLIESSQQYGVKTVSVPFELAADFIPERARTSDNALIALSASEPPAHAEFSDILYRSRQMQRVTAMARHVARRSVPVLLEGESGTGKELFARAIHRASSRAASPFIAVNCGAIPGELVESELFGHFKGAFTGAHKTRAGLFEAANGGTLFLDEIGELPLLAQVKLLRALQEGEIQRLGGQRPIKIDTRVIAATNRSLLDEVTSGRFRQDLFYRLAVAIIRLPPLREREGDVSLLIDAFIERINEESSREAGYKPKSLSASAKRVLLQHTWPGNVRELINTLRRAVIWSAAEVVTMEQMREALLPTSSSGSNDVLDRPLGSDLKLPEIIEKVARHYLERALEEAGGNKSKAAKLVGLPSYQTFTNWASRYKIPVNKS